MISRRELLAQAGVASVLVGVGRVGLAPLRAGASVSSGPVVSFHLDAPYLDPTGEALPYRPPPGARGGEKLAKLTEAELYSLTLI